MALKGFTRGMLAHGARRVNASDAYLAAACAVFLPVPPGRVYASRYAKRDH
jgi:hypothetical protein